MESNERLIEAVAEGDAHAATVLYDRYAAHVQRVLARIMGVDQELADLLNETFLQIIRGVHTVENPQALEAWITRVAVFTA
ncbi:MAG: hypothetical protein MO852_16040, partial [Candidatus Devosia euplotis]|nr:hypothetical protein [Candidatus Devosia euplotis]